MDAPSPQRPWSKSGKISLYFALDGLQKKRPVVTHPEGEETQKSQFWRNG